MSNMDRIETAINNLIINENEAIKSRIEEVRYCIDIPETNSKGYCYCLKVDANGRLRLQDLIEYIDFRIVDYAIPKKEIDEAKNDLNNTGSTRKIIQLRKKAENLFTDLDKTGEGAEINLCGMAIADKNQHVDNHTSIDHAVPNCTSNELFKYVLDDQSVGAFAGLVLVRPDAQHTNSQQTNRNLCATRDARMYTQPQLEIYADDVKCSHGATVGQLDEGALFYMRSRGIAEKEARLLLMFAFVNEVIDTIRLEALKDRLHLLVEKRFRGELNRCQGCAICK